ncbi:hypothetical protein A2837_01840 [Candidatus Kaiserbacteria bacterium RIFCSPHIGHO2_01_FULL_46_22]|uniref:Uncharacterized protein n=1 Tax=Candidatus Kaiserbacteria bacterium RIFCSPHIGHO2_01_FULL_46_22 TaxID=1798475 RepID=A0A1F6BYM7_9BACT|nr:MAG: hypothetical protein A2837_01840 [Candidatus Kaiserbacteria bacterium RIFCSPHIGHO2_01_FULL_46_22]
MKIKKIKLSNLKFGPIRNEVLPEGFILRVQKYKNKLKEVETSSLEETISNFQRDLHPEDELKVWEVIAELYETKARANWTNKERKECFKKLLLSTMS